MRRYTKTMFVTARKGRHHERGIALIGVLWLVMLLSALAGGLAMLARNDSYMASDELENAQAEALAEAGIYLTLNDLCNPVTTSAIPVAGQMRTLQIFGREVTVSIQDEAGKIDINFASKDLLSAALSASGFTSAASSQAAEKLDEERGKAMFHAPEDIRSSVAMSNAQFQRIKPMLTVYAQRSAVYPKVAPKEVLDVLPGIGKQEIHEILTARQSQQSQASRMAEEQNMAGEPENMEGRAFTILSTARAGRNVFTRLAVARIIGGVSQPFWIYQWTSPSQ